LFSHISMSWCGRPLISHEVTIEAIGAVTTKSGLRVQAALDTKTYPKGVRITDKDVRPFEAKHLQRHHFHDDWNYRDPSAQPTSNPTRQDNAPQFIAGPHSAG
jgi:hypothetical protein